MNRFLTIVLLVTGLALITATLLSPSYRASGAAPAAVLTPVSNNNTNGGVKFSTFFNGTPITTPTQVCVDLSAYDVGDFQVVVNQVGSNTVTVLHRYSNNNSNYVTGATLFSGTPVAAGTPSTAMSQQAYFGKYNCVDVGLANVTPVSVYVGVLSK